MPTWGSYSYAYGPFVVLVALGILMLVLRWAFGRGSSVVERPPERGNPDQYGLLDAIASPTTYIEAEILRQRLEAGGIKATVAMTNDGPRVMVWPGDRLRAKSIVREVA
ncbi:MAG: hypothetical protein ABI720_04270 [Actinomycetes bacterium]